MSKRANRIIYSLGICCLLVLIGICSFFAFYFFDLHKDDMGLIELNYREKANLDYSVLLTDGKYYNGKEAKSSFIVELMESVNAYFNYNITFSSLVKGDYTYKVKGNLYINDLSTNKSISSMNVYDSDNHVYQIEGNVINLSKDINIDINTALNKYKEIKATNTNKLSAVLIYDVVISYDVLSYEVNEMVSDTRTLTISIPLSNYISDITVTDPVDRSDIVLSDFSVGKDQIYPLVCLEFVGAIVLFIILIILLVRKFESTVTYYEQEKDYILHTYKELLINTDLMDLANKDIIFTKDIDSLAKIAYRTNLPINYTEITKDKECVFIIMSETVVYVYKLTNEKD